MLLRLLLSCFAAFALGSATTATATYPHERWTPTPDSATIPEDDADGDGYLNAYEWFHHTDPAIAASTPNPTLFVSAGAAAGGNGSSQKPFSTLQQALDMAQAFDIIQIAAGTYSGPGNRELTYRGKELMMIGQSGPVACVIDCKRSGCGVRFSSAETRLSVLSGLTVMNASDSAVWLQNASATLLNCQLINSTNTVGWNGGGLYGNNTQARLRNCILKGNAATEGGGLFLSASSCEILRCRIMNNRSTSGSGGGGILCDDGSHDRILGCTIDGNWSDSNGGGVECRPGSDATLEGCVIISNTSGDGGGLDQHPTALGLIRHCSIAFNRATDEGGGLRFSGSSPRVDDCLVAFNSAVEGGGIQGENSSPQISNTIIQNNSARSGGGVCIEASYTNNPPFVMNDCLVVSNSAVSTLANEPDAKGGGFMLRRTTLLGQRLDVSFNSSTDGGGGITCDSGRVDVASCAVHDNSAAEGGGVRCTGQGLVMNLRIYANSATRDAGGAWVDDRSKLSDCLIEGNSAADDAGGVKCKEGGNVLRCTIQRNTCADDGGGGVCEQGTFQYCLITGNRSNNDGGGLSCKEGAQINSCTVAANTAADAGGGLDCSAGAAIANTIISANSSDRDQNFRTAGASFDHCCASPTPAGQNFNADPLFVAPGSGNYTLSPLSPCIDSGRPVANDSQDLTRVPVPLVGKPSNKAAPDIGAYEYVSALTDTDSDGLNDLSEVSEYGSNPTRSNTDGDAHTDLMEAIAGTNPRDALSYFEVAAISVKAGDTGITLAWPSVAQRVYTVQRATKLGGPITSIASGLQATPPQNTFRDASAAGRSGAFYRVLVRRK